MSPRGKLASFKSALFASFMHIEVAFIDPFYGVQGKFLTISEPTADDRVKISADCADLHRFK